MFIQETKYTGNPAYICDKCGKRIENYRPLRISIKRYNLKRSDYVTENNKDYCKRCSMILENWINKKKEGN